MACHDALRKSNGDATSLQKIDRLPATTTEIPVLLQFGGCLRPTPLSQHKSLHRSAVVQHFKGLLTELIHEVLRHHGANTLQSPLQIGDNVLGFTGVLLLKGLSQELLPVLRMPSPVAPEQGSLPDL